jgi:hypothetical protein
VVGRRVSGDRIGEEQLWRWRQLAQWLRRTRPGPVDCSGPAASASGWVTLLSTGRVSGTAIPVCRRGMSGAVAVCQHRRSEARRRFRCEDCVVGDE